MADAAKVFDILHCANTLTTMVQQSTASTAGVIAYNGENPRGWNDPPTFAFSSNKGEQARAKPKLDLRKRVSHQQALTGTPSGMAFPTTTQPQNFAFRTNNDITQGLSSQVPFIPPSVSASTQQPFTVPPVTVATQPSIPVTMTTHQPVSATAGIPHSNGYMPAPSVPLFSSQNMTPCTSENGHLALHPIIKSVSVTSELMHVGEPPLTAKLTPPLNDNSTTNGTSTNLGQPLCSLGTHSYEPVVPAHPLAIRSGADINNLQLDDSSPTETTPQIFNPVMPPTIVGAPHLENVHATFHHRSLSFPGPKHMVEHINPPVGHKTPPPRLQNTASGHATPLPPPALENMTTPVQFVVGQSTTPPPPVGSSTTNQAPFMVGHSVTPPPHVARTTTTPPISLSAGNTPKASSPVSQHKKLSDDDLEDFDDEEGLKKTMDAFQDVIDKYQDKLQKRVVDDIKKRLQVMSQSWQNGKLSKFVKARMIHLAEALDGGNSDEAHRMHVSIIVDHVREVNQWMVGVKKLISVVSHNANGTVPHS